MTTFVILLRGVTPTGKNRVLMQPLREALEKAGLENVRTYIQSGNVVAESNLNSSELEKLVPEVIQQNSAGEIPVIARTAEQFSRIIELNPFEGEDVKKLYFTILASRPDPALLQTFLAAEFAPDQLRYVENTLYTLYATRYSDSRFNNNFYQRKLKVTATTRNFNTMTRLVAMSGGQ